MYFRHATAMPYYDQQARSARSKGDFEAFFEVSAMPQKSSR